METLAPAFWENVILHTGSGCWLWMAGHVGTGYGAYYPQVGYQRPAHRASYEALVGEIPSGLDLDHLCRNRSCVNPRHLEPVTRRINLLRSPLTVASGRAAQSACIHGHDFTPANTKIAANGTRHCKTCDNRRTRESYQRRRQAKVVV